MRHSESLWAASFRCGSVKQRPRLATVVRDVHLGRSARQISGCAS
jgi:hypothetical protein